MTSPPLDSTHGWQRQAWHDIIAVGQHTRSDDVRRGMPSSPLDSTDGRTTSGVSCHHRLWEAHTVESRQVWHATIAFGQHKRPNDVRGGMTSPWTEHTVEQRRAWHDITALGLHARSDDVGRGMTSPPLDSTHGWQRRAWHDITALGQHTRSATPGVARHHCLWTAHTVE